MADEVTGGFPDSSVENAAGLIESLLNPKQESETPPEAKADEPPPEPEQRRGKNPLQTQPDETQPAPVAEITEQPAPSAPPTPDPVQVQRSQAEQASIAQAEAARNQHIQAVTALTAQLEHAIAGEFSDIKTHQDLLRTAQEDPARYNRYVIHQGQLQALQAEKQRVEGEQNQVNLAKFREWQKGEVEKLPDLIPELKDPAKAPGLVTKLREFAQSKGYTDQQLTMATANDFATLYEAMNFRDMKAAQIQAAKKAANAPPVQRPGAQRDTNSKEEGLRTDFNRLRKTGRVEDAANVFKSILG